MKVLGIDTSGHVASVAVCDGDTVLAQTSVVTKLTHSQIILPLCKDVLRLAETELQDIDRIAVADGPGSYTGLRIGISAVKGMAFALKKDCVGVSTLEALAYNLAGYEGIICPVMSARGNLVYTATFSCDGKNITRITEDGITDAGELAASLDGKVIFVGDYAQEFIEKYGRDGFVAAPPHLRLQLASSVCFAGKDKESCGPDGINARYLQPTKAEKDKQEEEKCS